jgi:2-oxoisovalerate dehydrogenase E2 component (dihydrolipoyl transacylase)
MPLSGITEVQIIQWYVEEGAHIEEWKPLCQYQSDKAVDDVSSLRQLRGSLRSVE